MTLSGIELDGVLTEMRRVAADAGALLRQGLRNPKKISYKGAVDLVTEYDTRAEDLIRESLTKTFPDSDFLAEESSHLAPDNQKRFPLRWIVDPLDGTTNFAHGHPIFAVSIGLQEGEHLVAGTVFIPQLEEMYSARTGGGAYCNDTPISVSSTADLDTALLATGFPYDRRETEDDNTRELTRFIKRTQGVRRCGAAAVDLALVARGACDGYWEPKLHPWDIAAGTVLVQEAGGRVTDYSGGRINLENGWIVSSNGRIHDEMLQVIGDARAELSG